MVEPRGTGGWLAAARLAQTMAAPLFWVCAVLVSVIAFGPMPPVDAYTGWDKGNHLLAFAVLWVLAFVAWPRRGLHAALGLAAYALGIEAVQGLLPDRVADGADVVADALGLAAGWLLTWRGPLRWLAWAGRTA